MSKFRLSLILSIVLSLFSFDTAEVDRSKPSHYCFKPNRPYSGADERQWRSFKNDVESYKSCIESFVEEQEAAAKRHLKAAEDAVDEWNNFVQLELR